MRCLSLGFAVIFGMLQIVNFVHGAFYMVGAFIGLFLLKLFGVSYWWALIIAPLAVAVLGMIFERLLLRRLQGFDHIYGLLLTFGAALMIQGAFQNYFGTSGLPYPTPEPLHGAINLGFMYSAEISSVGGRRLVGRVLGDVAGDREDTPRRISSGGDRENPMLVRTFGINVPRMVMLTYGLGVGLAALAGVLSAPINQVQPLMGADLVIVVFAIVVIGGMRSVKGAIIAGYTLGVIESLTQYFYSQASSTVIFVLMAFVILIKPAGHAWEER